MGRIFVKENGHLSLGNRGFRSGTKYVPEINFGNITNQATPEVVF